MTEKEWLTSEYPTGMLEYLKRCRRYRISARKVLLFGCRAVRRIGNKLAYQESEDAIRVAERFADGRATADEMNEARRAARRAVNSVTREDGGDPARDAAHAAWCLVRLPNDQSLNRMFLLNTMQELIGSLLRVYWLEPERKHRERQALAVLIREVVGNPFDVAEIDAEWLAWNNRTVVRMAETIYLERRWDDLPILADALEDAGCSDRRILDHCRQPGTHCRGCWLVDELLPHE